MRIVFIMLAATLCLWGLDTDNSRFDNGINDDTTFISETHLLTHKKNFVMFFLYDFNPHEAYRDAKESMFQISLKRKLLNTIFEQDIQLYFGYTQKSFWQIYDADHSRPFRETNYNPELFFAKRAPDSLKQYALHHLYAGYEHESNGQSVLTSRSWDRFYVQAFFKQGDFGGNIKAWTRIPESEKKDPTDPYGDDNPDITDYYGYTELNLHYDYYDHRFGLFLRKRAAILDISIPFGDVYFYTRYFNGYGESLIDYDEYIQKIGFGIQLNR